MKTSAQKHENGFIALISILIVSVVLLATTLSLAQFGIASRYFILDLEQKAASEKLAEACVHIARINVYNDPAYEVDPGDNVTMPIGGETCSIVHVEPGTPSIVRTKGVSGKAVTNLEVEIDPATGDFERWVELTFL